MPNLWDDGQGWEQTHKVILEPVWTIGPILPPSLMDILEKTVEENEEKAAVEEEGEEKEGEE